ncbi:DNA-directed RNA polymerase III subunit RPC10 [Aspergillus terreus]|uniref:DNA-directed RNA polymerase III subunit RPC10 n=1 Tax=Aspergillus terreus TaxID=33178 RepID=A0A5M3YXL8_ASPTE|nr:hypothetical protein ATETN484_0005022700 [Aspergillus terreus]GFF16892.1 DNA-directed RNA polymerase III subunit RPC10 [Aspergillus terreus]
MPLTFCPNCSNALTISRGEPTPRHPLGVNRFECRTCPYQYNLEQSYFEKTPMKQKEVEDVFGGKEEFANADSMASMLRTFPYGSDIRKWWVRRLTSVFFQRNAPQRTATATVHTFSSCRFEVQTSR